MTVYQLCVCVCQQLAQFDCMKHQCDVSAYANNLHYSDQMRGCRTYVSQSFGRSTVDYCQDYTCYKSLLRVQQPQTSSLVMLIRAAQHTVWSLSVDRWTSKSNDITMGAGSAVCHADSPNSHTWTIVTHYCTNRSPTCTTSCQDCLSSLVRCSCQWPFLNRLRFYEIIIALETVYFRTIQTSRIDSWWFYNPSLARNSLHC